VALRLTNGVLALVIAALAAAAVHVSVRAQTRTTWDGVYTEEQAARGDALYKEHCTRCHGPNLQGNGEGAGPLIGPPFTTNWNGVGMGVMLERVRQSMPLDRPGTMTRQQVADLLAFVLQSNKFPAGKVELVRQPDMLNSITFQLEK
jgi:mono/diheme cytochrome c family protein